MRLRVINVLRCAVAIIVAKQSELALTARAHTHTHTGVKLGAQTHTGVSTEIKTDKKNRIGEQEMKNKKEQLAFSSEARTANAVLRSQCKRFQLL